MGPAGRNAKNTTLMKTILSSLIGTRNIVASDPNVQLFQVREVLNQHRDTLINRLLIDVPTYIDFKFKTKPSRNEVSEITDTLVNLKRTNVDLDRFHPLVKKIQRRNRYKLTNELFFSEIDELIRRKIQKPQLELLR
jgi:hypothetical protein